MNPIFHKGDSPTHRKLCDIIRTRCSHYFPGCHIVPLLCTTIIVLTYSLTFENVSMYAKISLVTLLFFGFLSTIYLTVEIRVPGTICVNELHHEIGAGSSSSIDNENLPVLSICGSQPLKRTPILVSSFSFRNESLYERGAEQKASEFILKYHVASVSLGASDCVPPLTVFYPTRIIEENNQNSSSSSTFSPWVPFGDMEHLTQFALALRLPWISMNHLQWVRIRNDQNFFTMFTKQGTNQRDNEVDIAEIIVFSHGLFGHQNMYSALALDLASTGCIVIVPTHRDGSAAYSGDEQTVSDRISRKNTEYFSNKYAYQQPPPDVKKALMLRQRQLQHRSLELLSILLSVQNGSLFRRCDLENFSERIWVQNENSPKIRLVGHSFGGSTVLQTLVQMVHSISQNHSLDAEFQKFKCEGYKFPSKRFAPPVLLDAWIEPLLDSSYQQHIAKFSGDDLQYFRELTNNITFLDSEQWERWTQHKEQMLGLAEDCLTRNGIHWCRVGFRLTDHYSVSDMGYLLHHFGRKRPCTSWFQQARIDRDVITCWAAEIRRFR